MFIDQTLLPMASSSDPIAAVPALRPLHILYAEDLKQLRDFMSIMLGREGHKVETADDGATALERLGPDGNEFDVLITDHHMPRLNGLELVRSVRNLPFNGKIVIFSSELNDSVHEEYRRLGVDLILPKPIFPVTFRRLLGQLFAPPAVPA
jgi:two-component system chemotaxis response regulator CheY